MGNETATYPKGSLGYFIETAETIVLRFSVQLEGRGVGGCTPLTRDEARHLAAVYPAALAAVGTLNHGYHGEGWFFGSPAIYDKSPARLEIHAR
tara:strand:+ start:321 stop:602 length:282 start_codon:yes stop_codon:yes gene_type:complete